MTKYFVDYGRVYKYVIIFRLEGVKLGHEYVVNSSKLLINNKNVKDTIEFVEGDKIAFNVLNTAHQVIEMIFEVIYK